LDGGKVELIFCDELLDELMEVVSRPKLSKFFTIEDWALVYEIIDRHAIYIPVVSSVTLCRDEKDNFLLSLAQDANANCLLTGDKDLLILKTFDKTKIITIAEFRTMIK
jgi:putative PIN family toxin of toxin-antitoxin system